MEKFMQRENVHFGYGKSSRIPDTGDTNFNDVFGGPPRRFSMQEVRARYSFGDSEEETDSSPWKEKPVFGEDTTPRRRKGADFFDDIFKGGDRDRDRDSALGSSPSSRIISPKADPSATSLPPPAQFSLPARLSKGMDLPTFGSHNHGEKSNGFSSPQSWSSLSRFSSGAAGNMDDSVHPVARQSPLSNEASFTTEKDTNNNVDSIANQFHFSIYKWPGRGVPMLMPLVIENNNLKSKDNIKSAASNGRVERKASSLRRRGFSAAPGEVASKEELNRAHFSESESKSSPTDSVGVKEEQVKSVDDSKVGEKVEKQVPVKLREGFKSEVKKTFHEFLAEVGQPGKKKDPHDRNKVKKKGGEEVGSNNANSTGTRGKSAASKGKVKEFVQVFNQEADVSKQGNVGSDQKVVNELGSNPAKVEQVKLPNVDKKQDVPFKVVESPKNDEAQGGFSPARTPTPTTTRSFSTLRRSFSAGAQPHKDFKMSPANLDDLLEENFVVQELSDGYENVTQKESSEDTKAIDDKIRQWSVGKKGNIRSLLSTLQFVLWAESGWKAVPLVDLIEANSVKRAYQKALLRLHPDKLQQKGAPTQHKYIAEKVFDILQEAWDHFNTCSSLGI